MRFLFIFVVHKNANEMKFTDNLLTDKDFEMLKEIDKESKSTHIARKTTQNKSTTTLKSTSI